VTVCVWPLRKHLTLKLCANGLHDVPSATGLGRSTSTAQSQMEVTHGFPGPTSAVASQLSTRSSGGWTKSALVQRSMLTAERWFNIQ